MLRRGERDGGAGVVMPAALDPSIAEEGTRLPEGCQRVAFLRVPGATPANWTTVAWGDAIRVNFDQLCPKLTKYLVIPTQCVNTPNQKYVINPYVHKLAPLRQFVGS